MCPEGWPHATGKDVSLLPPRSRGILSLEAHHNHKAHSRRTCIHSKSYRNCTLTHCYPTRLGTAPLSGDHAPSPRVLRSSPTQHRPLAALSSPPRRVPQRTPPQPQFPGWHGAGRGRGSAQTTLGGARELT